MFGLYQYQVSPTDKSSNAKVEVVIKQGMSTSQIASLLKKKYLIKDEFFF